MSFPFSAEQHTFSSKENERAFSFQHHKKRRLEMRFGLQKILQEDSTDVGQEQFDLTKPGEVARRSDLDVLVTRTVLLEKKLDDITVAIRFLIWFVVEVGSIAILMILKVHIALGRL